MEIKKALIFKPASIGDSLMAKYFLENIHALYPQAKLGIVVGSRGNMIADLLAAYPWIEVQEVNRRKPLSIVRLLKNYWRSDIVCTPYASGPTNLSTKLIARLLAKRGGLVGFADSSPYGFLYGKIVPLVGYQTPRLLEQKALLAAGVPVSLEWPAFAYNPQPQILARFNLQKNGYAVVHLFSGSENRGLSPERRQTLITALAKALPGIPLVFTGSHKERAALESLQLPKPAVVAAGDTSVQELAELIGSSAFVVAVGSGASHIASHLGKKNIALADCRSAAWCTSDQYGKNAPLLFTRQDMCPGGHRDIPYPPCMNEIDMQAVAEAAKAFISHANS